MITKSVVVRLAVAVVVFLTAGAAIARGVVSRGDAQRALSSTASSSQESSVARFPSKALILTHRVKTHRAEMEATKPVGTQFVVAKPAHSSPPSSASAFIEQPAAGSTVSRPVRLLFGVRGRCIGGPATGCDHFHIYVDGSSRYFAPLQHFHLPQPGSWLTRDPSRGGPAEPRLHRDRSLGDVPGLLMCP